MSNFLNSPIINEEISEINKLQEKVIFETFNFYRLTEEDKINHVKDLETLLEKQRIFYMRLKLSQDPDAKFLLTKLLNSAKMSGVISSEDMNDAFLLFEKKIARMKSMLDIKD
jgi:hypothetical protein